MKPKDLIDQYFTCTCDEMYKRRNLTDPGCFLCNYEETIEEVMTLYANQQLTDFVNWINEVHPGNYVPNSRIGQFNISQNEKS
jgi:hypothetical protein